MHEGQYSRKESAMKAFCTRAITSDYSSTSLAVNRICFFFFEYMAVHIRIKYIFFQLKLVLTHGTCYRMTGKIRHRKAPKFADKSLELKSFKI
jgi:hypothetical protein